jgi:hypothetical protein
MDTQASTDNHPEDAIDNKCWNWTMETEEGQPFQPYPCLNATHSAHCRPDTNCSSNLKAINNSIQEDAMSVTSSPFVPISYGEQATPENEPSHRTTKAWHLTSHKTSMGKQTSYCSADPDGSRFDEVMLVVSLNATNDNLSITPCFPAWSKTESARWDDPNIMSPALAQIEMILADLDPSVCLKVKTKALETYERGAHGDWHVKALNTLEAEHPSHVTGYLGMLSVKFGQLSKGATIQPGAYYDNRKEIIQRPGLKYVLETNQANRLFAQLPENHRSYRPLPLGRDTQSSVEAEI